MLAVKLGEPTVRPSAQGPAMTFEDEADRPLIAHPGAGQELRHRHRIDGVRGHTPRPELATGKGRHVAVLTAG